jgi:hypothetical protein
MPLTMKKMGDGTIFLIELLLMAKQGRVMVPLLFFFSYYNPKLITHVLEIDNCGEGFYSCCLLLLE